ncbi:MAG: hypothetical protein P4L85_27500 [Paludisphaera borealis]|uniref:hypothetical protein n=1 Tax=Paludisphaera borealis TaxID=1387353 RepID=UPI00284CF11D|nr:hypothetical protein [Paludisphaera borealis]MDR3623129.1 hypothetical protein [Paludisphaera borealis]
MSNDPRRIIVMESRCDACSAHMFRVHHQNFPEMQHEDASAEQAVEHLAERMAADLDCVPDPSHREAVQLAIDDARAFLDAKRAVPPAPAAR